MVCGEAARQREDFRPLKLWVRQASPYGRATALERAKQAFANASAVIIAFSSEVDTGSREENASK
jgi:hypothetical protein